MSVKWFYNTILMEIQFWNENNCVKQNNNLTDKYMAS